MLPHPQDPGDSGFDVLANGERRADQIHFASTDIVVREVAPLFRDSVCVSQAPRRIGVWIVLGFGNDVLNPVAWVNQMALPAAPAGAVGLINPAVALPAASQFLPLAIQVVFVLGVLLHHHQLIVEHVAAGVWHRAKYAELGLG